MALKLAGKNPAKFEFDDGVSQTVVTIQPDDEPDVVRAKLQRVLELEGGPLPGAMEIAASVRRQVLLGPEVPVFTPADRASVDARMAAVQTSGWNEDTDMDNLPEYG